MFFFKHKKQKFIKFKKAIEEIKYLKYSMLDEITIIKSDNDFEYNFIDFNRFSNLEKVTLINVDIVNIVEDLIKRCSTIKVIECINCDINIKLKKKMLYKKMISLRKNYAKLNKICFKAVRVIQIRERKDNYKFTAMNHFRLMKLEELRDSMNRKNAVEYLSRIRYLKFVNVNNIEDADKI